MSSSPSGKDVLVLTVMAFGYGALAAWGLCYVWGSAPAVKPIDLPAWTQAVGSILAIAVAIAVPNVIHSRERRDLRDDKLRREKSFILAVLPAVQLMLSKLRQARWAATDTDEPPEKANFRYAMELLDFPPDLKELRLQLYEAGSAAENLHRALAKILHIQMILSYAHDFSRSDGLYWDDGAGELLDMRKPDDYFTPIDEATLLLEDSIAEMSAVLQ